jgi:hypothetical protein
MPLRNRVACFTALAILFFLPVQGAETKTSTPPTEITTASDTIVIVSLAGSTPSAGGARNRIPGCGSSRCDVCATLPAGASIQHVELSTRPAGAGAWEACQLDTSRQFWSCGREGRSQWFPGHYVTATRGILLSVCMQARNSDAAPREARLAVTWRVPGRHP